jgi:hypothetical protein
MTKLEKSIVECLDAQKELLQSINELTIIMKKVFNGEPSHDPAVEEGDIDRDLAEDKFHEEKQVLPDDDEDKDKDN